MTSPFLEGAIPELDPYTTSKDSPLPIPLPFKSNKLRLDCW